MARCRIGSSFVFVVHSDSGAAWGCNGEGAADLACVFSDELPAAVPCFFGRLVMVIVQGGVLDIR